MLTVVSWMLVAGLFARPVPINLPERTLPKRATLSAVDRLPADWSRRIQGDPRGFFPGVPVEQSQAVIGIVERHARRAHVDPLMVLAVIQVESRFDARAVSSQGAMGLMQLQSDTARDLAMDLGVQWTGDDLLFDPDLNVMLGCTYLRRLIDRFGDVDAALAAYCSGPTLVEARRDANGKIPLAYSDRVWDVLRTLQAKILV